MNRNRNVGAAFVAIGFSLLIFQILVIGVAMPEGYFFIHDWVFYAVNYVIIFCLFFIGSFIAGNKTVRSLLLFAGLALLTANTTFFYYMGDVNVVIFESEDGRHEVILKENRKMNAETLRLKRRGFIFGREDAVLAGTSEYKAFEEGRYKFGWVAEDIAAVTYETDDGSLRQELFNFRSSDYVRYQNVAVGLRGRWVERENRENYFLSDNSEMVYAKDGELHYYRIENTRQSGIYSLIIIGDEEKPTLTVVLEPGTEFDDDNMIDGSITIAPVTLEDVEGEVYDREVWQDS